MTPQLIDQLAADIAMERRRQIAKGRTPEHDDRHERGEIALAAALYALPYDSGIINQDDFIRLQMALELGCEWSVTPDRDPRRRLIKAAALIMAEIERRDRISSKEA